MPAICGLPARLTAVGAVFRAESAAGVVDDMNGYITPKMISPNQEGRIQYGQ